MSLLQAKAPFSDKKAEILDKSSKNCETIAWEETLIGRYLPNTEVNSFENFADSEQSENPILKNGCYVQRNCKQAKQSRK